MPPLETSSTYRIVDLFAGTGAFSLAFHQTQRAHTVFANDFDSTSRTIFEANLPGVTLNRLDIHDVKPEDIPRMDVLTAGFPCQPFSISGHQKGFDDNRAQVFWALTKIIKHHMPPVIFLENVKNLVSHDEGITFDTIRNALMSLGYTLQYQVLNTCKVTDIPQNRERIYIVGFTDPEKAARFRFPEETLDLLPVSSLLEPMDAIPDKYYYDDRYKVWPIVEEGVTKNVYEHNTLYQLRRWYVRENKKNVCPTLTACAGSGGHNTPLLKDARGIRKLTPRECFNIQGFHPSSYVIPESLSDAALYRLSGNAVSIPVIHKIAKTIVEVLDSGLLYSS